MRLLWLPPEVPFRYCVREQGEGMKCMILSPGHRLHCATPGNRAKRQDARSSRRKLLVMYHYGAPCGHQKCQTEQQYYLPTLHEMS